MQTRDWQAWINLMPPKPDDMHVHGEVYVSNPGVVAQLTVKEPQGGSAETLVLDLFLSQQPGMWPQVMTWVPARFDKVLKPDHPKYQTVEIVHYGATIQTLPVERVQ